MKYNILFYSGNVFVVLIQIILSILSGMGRVLSLFSEIVCVGLVLFPSYVCRVSLSVNPPSSGFPLW